MTDHFIYQGGCREQRIHANFEDWCQGKHRQDG